MKVRIKDLEPNPYRDMDNYPVDQFKIESLKNSIEQTGFWDNIVARPKPDVEGKYQLAYGHHRLITLKELGITEIDIPVKDLDDYIMIQIMANENRIEYKYNTDVTIETVKAAKEFLDAELRSYNTWEEFHAVNVSRMKYYGDLQREYFSRLRSEGVGHGIIRNFLGDNWSEAEIRDSLDTLDSEDIDRRSLSVLAVPAISSAFKHAVKKINNEKKASHEDLLSGDDQVRLAEAIKERINPTDGSEKPKVFSAGGRSYKAIVETMVRQELDNTDEYDTALNEVALKLKAIDAESAQLANKIGFLNGTLDAMQIDEIRSLDTTLMMSTFSRLLENLNGLTVRLGFEILNLKDN